MKCPECGIETTDHSGTFMTLVGYGSPEGHDHDDNCRSRHYLCANGHRWQESKQNRCPTEGCAWVGKLTCFCHKGEKVREWSDPEVGQANLRALT